MLIPPSYTYGLRFWGTLVLKPDNPATTPIRSKVASDRYSVPALDKAMDVLELLGASHNGLTVSAIGEALGRTVGEIYRIVISLEDLSILTREETEGDRYTLSLTLFEWAHRHLPTERLAKLAQPVMERLTFETKQSCQLAVLQDFSVLITANASSPLALQFDVRVGTRLAAQESSAGLVILAHMPNAAFEVLAAASEVEARSDLQKRLDGIRSAGRDISKSPIVPNITDITAPIFDHRGNVAAALTIPYLGQLYAELTIPQCEISLVAAARRLSVALGGADFSLPQAS